MQAYMKQITVKVSDALDVKMRHEAARRGMPGASDQIVCQRAGTLSGVVVIAARFMSQTLAGRSDVHTVIPGQGCPGRAGVAHDLTWMFLNPQVVAGSVESDVSSSSAFALVDGGDRQERRGRRDSDLAGFRPGWRGDVDQPFRQLVERSLRSSADVEQLMASGSAGPCRESGRGRWCREPRRAGTCPWTGSVLADTAYRLLVS